MEAETHPSEGDTLEITSSVRNRSILGLGLSEGDTVTVENINTVETFGSVSSETLTLRRDDGETVVARYRGRVPITGERGMPITVTNGQGAEQSFNWQIA